MATTSFSKVTVDNANRQRSKFNLNHSTAISMGFGEVFPVHCQKMVPDSKHVCSTRSLLRLDPMVAPTSQGRITCKQWHSFIGLSDLFRDHGAFLTAQPRATADGVKVVPRLPEMMHCNLSTFTLIGCKFTPYVYDPGTEKYTLLTDSSAIAAEVAVLEQFGGAGNWLRDGASADEQARFPDFYAPGFNYYFDPRMFGLLNWHTNIPCGNLIVGGNKGSVFNVDPVNIDKCDKVFHWTIYDSNDVGHSYAFAVNLSSFGKRLYNILEVLGYGVDYYDPENVDLTRLFAEYIAYYGSFGLSMWTNYESTACCEFLRGYENARNNYTQVDDTYTVTSFGDTKSLNNVFVRFIHELVDCYATDPVDYVAAFRKRDVSGTNDSGFLSNIICTQGFTPPFGHNSGRPTQLPPNTVDTDTGALYINNVNHSQVDADLLKLLYKSINRQTVAGRRIAELLRAGGYGDYVDEQKSHFLGYTEYDVDVSDINATADGVNTVTGKQSNLGEYVGKGFGSSKSDEKFTYETNEFGYWITLCAIVPESTYAQGCDTTVFDCEREQQYNVEYDSMGYEIERKRVVKSGADCVPLSVLNPSNSQSNESFGLIPRFMRYKVARSILAGNFKLRSRRDAYLPFVLCRWIDADDMHVSGQPVTTSTGIEYKMIRSTNTQDLPIAGNAWRYVNAFPWLANFDRIFAFNNPQPYDAEVPNILARWKYTALNEDFFMLFMRVQHTCYAPMLPIEDSWSTTDDNDGKGTSMTVA